jgi:hypothetical protein
VGNTGTPSAGSRFRVLPRISGLALASRHESRCSDASTPGAEAVMPFRDGGQSMLKTRRFLAVVTVVAGASLGGLAALAAPLGSLNGLPEATGTSIVTPAGGWWNCWWKYGCKYCKWCSYKYGVKYCGDVTKTCKKKGGYYY